MFPLRRTSSDKIMLFSSQPLRDVKGGPHCPPAISACNWAASAGRAPSLGVTTAKSPQPRQSYAKIRTVRRRRLRCAGKPVTGKIRPAARTPENLAPALRFPPTAADFTTIQGWTAVGFRGDTCRSPGHEQGTGFDPNPPFASIDSNAGPCPTLAICPELVGALRAQKERPFTLNAAAIR